MDASGDRHACRLFISYAHRDGRPFDRLVTHLEALRREGLVEAWHDRKIAPGDEWRGRIDEQLNHADVVLLLVSADFIRSDYCVDVELTRAMERRAADGVDVLPVIVKPCQWKRVPVRGVPLGELQALPPEGRPVSKWSDRDEAWSAVVAGIERLVRTRQGAADRTRPPKDTVVMSDEGGYALVHVPGGVFRMGSPDDDAQRRDRETPARDVRVEGLLAGRAPVTNAEYKRYLEAVPDAIRPARWTDPAFSAPDQPVVGVSWDEAGRFCEWAGLRLPTETEWEYICRAGSDASWCCGADERVLATYAWFGRPDRRGPHPVGGKHPNPFGLHDLHGNVAEWCEDDWHDSYHGAFGDGRAWVERPRSKQRVVRGGAWTAGAEFCRSAHRQGWRPGARVDTVGFRAVKSGR